MFLLEEQKTEALILSTKNSELGLIEKENVDAEPAFIVFLVDVVVVGKAARVVFG